MKGSVGDEEDEPYHCVSTCAANRAAAMPLLLLLPPSTKAAADRNPVRACNTDGNNSGTYVNPAHANRNLSNTNDGAGVSLARTWVVGMGVTTASCKSENCKPLVLLLTVVVEEVEEEVVEEEEEEEELFEGNNHRARAAAIASSMCWAAVAVAIAAGANS